MSEQTERNILILVFIIALAVLIAVITNGNFKIKHTNRYVSEKIEIYRK